MQICVYGASSSTLDPVYLQAGHALGLALARRGHGLVFGAGDHGLMGAVARGVHAGGGSVTGVSPTFFQVDGVLYPHCDRMLYTETMRERKQRMEELADAFIMTPGGIGTFEEFFEILTLRQLGRHAKPIGILNANGYFDGLLELLQKAAREHFMTDACNRLYLVSHEPEALLDALEHCRPETGSVSDYKPIYEEESS